MPRFSVALSALALCAFVLLAACSGNNKNGEPSPAATGTPAAASPTAGATETPEATEEPFAGARDPIVVPAQAQGAPLLVDVRTGEHSDYDRITFEFDGDALPGYRVEYITPPATGCASGLPATIAGTAVLQVKFQPANAHDDQGNATITATEIMPGLPTLLEAEQTCDFEADVTWDAGLSQEVDFRVLELDTPPRLAIDVAHP